jgi:hypothetical protein
MKGRLAAAGWDRRSRLRQAGERGEDLVDFTTVFEAVIVAFAVAVVAHHIGQAERAQYIAHARHASADHYRASRGVQSSRFKSSMLEAAEKCLRSVWDS